MFPREFTYPGYDNKEHKETWWFNLSAAELAELQLSTTDGLDGMMRRLLRENQPDKVVFAFKSLILKAVGERSADGRKFIKKERPGMPWGEIAEDFKETPAYSQLFIELVSDPKNLTEFLLKAIPEEMSAKIKAASGEESDAVSTAEPSDNVIPFAPTEKTDAP